jgi:thiol:disulfide interchange protein DsbD
MKITLFATAIMFLSFKTISQNHVKWSFSFDETTSSIVLVGDIDPTWHMYSQQTNPNSGPVATSVNIQKNKNIVVKGNAKELIEVHKVFDKNFEAEVFLIENQYKATVPLKIKKNTLVEGTVSYMVCDETKCLPPIDVPFKIQVNTK